MAPSVDRTWTWRQSGKTENLSNLWATVNPLDFSSQVNNVSHIQHAPTSLSCGLAESRKGYASNLRLTSTGLDSVMLHTTLFVDTEPT